jgi:hypothetical protein
VSAPVLVADAPDPDREGQGIPSLAAEVGKEAASLVAVGHPVPHLLDRAVPGVVADVGLAADQPAPLHELVGAERVRLPDAPGHVVRGSTVRAHSISPVIAAGEAPTRPAHNGELQFLQGVDDISAKSLAV